MQTTNAPEFPTVINDPFKTLRSENYEVMKQLQDKLLAMGNAPGTLMKLEDTLFIQSPSFFRKLLPCTSSNPCSLDAARYFCMRSPVSIKDAAAKAQEVARAKLADDCAVTVPIEHVHVSTDLRPMRLIIASDVGDTLSLESTSKRKEVLESLLLRVKNDYGRPYLEEGELHVRLFSAPPIIPSQKFKEDLAFYYLGRELYNVWGLDQSSIVLALEQTGKEDLEHQASNNQEGISAKTPTIQSSASTSPVPPYPPKSSRPH